MTTLAIGSQSLTTRRFFTDTGFPLFLMTATVVYELFLLAIVFAPAESTAWWGGFAEEFKRWCFSYDPRTGGMEYASVVVMLIEPLFIGVIAAFLWRKGLAGLRHRRLSRLDRWSIASGVGIGALVIAGLFLVGRPDPADSEALPFPGSRIRVSLSPPDFVLVDHRGNSFSLDQAKGKVVLLTGVYAMCSETCPDILMQTKGVLDALPDSLQDQVQVVALSLNPEYDTSSLMGRVAEGYGFSYPQFRYLNGDPGMMDRLLQRFGFSRAVDPQTGVVNHASLFLFLDRSGKIAYRLALDERTEAWMSEAVLDLANE
ncbi:SCO family protein [Pelagicoccus enzymogenes]|uniref:SCO family protein n=1 Tax=Pelagicoccus enzymogenes TaxID=2773457 RepID=UPI00280F0065|nr:SCO family protein [Pelagicoccus enzymogenes]MDQ8200285.1 SCO family protein [Pelagicoccus enzymogenes]